ncbi:unnamed protein product [Adineta steineri]|uniref:Uncharacterized protein n=1 Tax=Adineta steineri TaxID=433720 RepID=A0A818W5B3_9BILA|nr:unnamed protein product [Adineta steineri]CAF1358232.1 unnamed protein product [Adineta steineri]CAF3720398.1 unnamed protein product [Adineta steineri]CAF3878065.1 unnamed protein product [Adineta steineri]
MFSNVRILGDALHENCAVSDNGSCIGSYLWKKREVTSMQSNVAIITSSRPEYLFVEQGYYMYGFLVISSYKTFNDEAILNFLRRT